MNKLFKFLFRAAISLILTFILLEVGLAWLSRTSRFARLPKPSYCWSNIGSRFWADSNPWFGVWHDPHSRFKHISAEYNLSYQANAWGMRDRERDKSAHGKKRVVVLGDSFMEGWGVATDDRMSDRLERATGLEHLNFGTSGSFGPTQYLMLYTHFAKDFEHSALIIAILPDNDFIDDDPVLCVKLHAGRIRPLFTGTKPDYQLTISKPPAPSTESKFIEQVLLQFTYSGNLIKRIKDLAKYKELAPAAGYAGYFDFTPAQWDRMEHVLQEFRKAAPTLPILVLTIPCDTDFQRTALKGEAPLPAKMRELCKTLDIQYLDLMPSIKSAPGGWSSCYYPADRHWNAHGDEVAAEAVRKMAAFYR